VREKRFKITALDVIVLLLVSAAVFYLAHRVRSELQYEWHWSAIPQYLLRFDATAGVWRPNVLVQGLLTTIRLSLWATLLATIFGTLMGILRVSAGLFNRLIGATYVEIVRNLPPLVLVFIFYFFIGDQILPAIGIEEVVSGLSAPGRRVLAMLFGPPPLIVPFVSAVLTLAVFEGAYITEIVRSGIQSIEKGQWEAAAALGLTKTRQLRHIILPQAVQRILPPLAGQFISTIKDSAIVSVISIQELTFQGMELMATTYFTFEIWLTITGLYLVLTLSCSVALERFNTRLRTKLSAPRP
jgi:polar amino acid transport system permease protein